MATSFFGNSEAETEQRIFEMLDQAAPLQRIPQDDLDDLVRHMISDQIIRPDGLLVFPDDDEFRCLRGRVFALEIKPDQVVRDHLKMISEMTEQARSYVDSRYDMPDVVPHGELDGCIVYPDLDTILAGMEPNPSGVRRSRNDDYKQGVLDMQRRAMSRQRIYELVVTQSGFEILCCDEWLCRFFRQDSSWQVSGKNHQFRRKIGSDYR